MLTATFNTGAHGVIEVQLGGEAYFKQDDFCSPISSKGVFSDQHGRMYQVKWPTVKDSQVAQLIRWLPTPVANAKIANMRMTA